MFAHVSINHYPIIKKWGVFWDSCTLFNLFFDLSQRPRQSSNPFASLVLRFVHPSWKTQKSVLFLDIYRLAEPYTEFLSGFSDFLSDLALSSDKILIVGDFNVHVDAKKWQRHRTI